MPVLVKTPSYPLVISPPAQGAQGEWHIEQTEQGCKAVFMQNSQLLGFALGGDAVAEKQALSKLLPAMLS